MQKMYQLIQRPHTLKIVNRYRPVLPSA